MRGFDEPMIQPGDAIEMGGKPFVVVSVDSTTCLTVRRPGWWGFILFAMRHPILAWRAWRRTRRLRAEVHG